MLDFIAGTVVPLILGGVFTHIGRDLYDGYIKPQLNNSRSKEEPSPTPNRIVSEETTTPGFKKTGNGYTATFFN